MARGKQVIQLLRTVDLIARPQGATIKELQTALGISRRSVYREIRTLEELGFPLEEAERDVENRARHRLLQEYVQKLPNIQVPDLRLDLDELMALNTVRADTGLYSGTEIATVIDRALKKLGSFLPEATVEKLQRLGTLFVSGTGLAKDYSEKDEIIEDLMSAMLQMRRCLVAYDSFSGDAQKKFRIEPLHFYEQNRGLYLFVRIPKFESIRTLAVERIASIEVEAEHFELPKDFDPVERIDSAFQITYDDPIAVRILFSESVARYIRERRWAAGQKLQAAADGGVLLEMETSGRKEVLMWVLSFGADAEVLEPHDLRDEVADVARRVLASYGR